MRYPTGGIYLWGFGAIDRHGENLRIRKMGSAAHIYSSLKGHQNVIDLLE